MTRRRSGQREFRRDIQGLRAIAVLAILFNHAGMSSFQGGYVGVDVFFVLSGFLITRHLVDEVTSTGRIEFADFYARRARRILPAAFAVLVLTVVAAVALQPPLLLPVTLRNAVVAALYVPNVQFARQQYNYFKPGDTPSLFQHYWSLGLEEQFYLLWPVLLLLAFAALGRSRRSIAIVLGLTAVVSFSFSVHNTPEAPLWSFYMLPTRAWEFAVGGLLALLPARARRSGDAAQRRAAWLAPSLGWSGLALIAYAIHRFGFLTPFPGWRAAIPVAGTALVILTGSEKGRFAPQRLLSTAPMLFLGLISYSVYLVHWPLLVLADQTLGLIAPLPGSARIGLAVAAIPLGYLMYRFAEKPWRGARFGVAHRSRQTLAGALAASVAIAGLSMAGVHAAGAQDLDAGYVAATTPLGVPLELNPLGALAVPSNLQPSLWLATEPPVSAIYTSGCYLFAGQAVLKSCKSGANPAAPRVVLFGDSHAAHFYPALAALADAGDIRLDAMTKSGCRTVERDTDDPTCRLWRRRAIAMLHDDPPEIILVGNRSFRTPGWPRLLPESIDRLPKRSRIFVIADTPDMGFSVPVCLSAHLNAANACSRPRHDVLSTANREVERGLGVGILDVTDYLCNQEYCPTIVGNLLLYRDYGHLTEPFARTLAPVLRTQLLG